MFFPGTRLGDREVGQKGTDRVVVHDIILVRRDGHVARHPSRIQDLDEVPFLLHGVGQLQVDRRLVGRGTGGVAHDVVVHLNHQHVVGIELGANRVALAEGARHAAWRPKSQPVQASTLLTAIPTGAAIGAIFGFDGARTRRRHDVDDGVMHDRRVTGAYTKARHVLGGGGSPRQDETTVLIRRRLHLKSLRHGQCRVDTKAGAAEAAGAT